MEAHATQSEGAETAPAADFLSSAFGFWHSSYAAKGCQNTMPEQLRYTFRSHVSRWGKYKSPGYRDFYCFRNELSFRFLDSDLFLS
jgi:hypothetical protein